MSIFEALPIGWMLRKTCHKLVGTPIHFTCDEIYHRIPWKHSYLLKKNGHQVSKLPPSDTFCCIFSCYRIMTGKPRHTRNKVYHWIEIWWKGSTHTLRKVRVPISQYLPHRKSFAEISYGIRRLWKDTSIFWNLATFSCKTQRGNETRLRWFTLRLNNRFFFFKQLDMDYLSSSMEYF